MPYCVNIGDSNQPKFVCRECEQNCDCPLDSYCVKSQKASNSVSERGTCKKIDTTDGRIGKPCIQFNFKDAQRVGLQPKYPTLGVDEKLVCGLAVFDIADTFDFYEWLGYCKQGICKKCAAWGPELEQTLNYFQEYEPSSLLCAGRTCIGSELATADHAKEKEEKTWVNVTTPESINGAILAFVILITLLNSVMCLCTVRNSLGPKKYKRVAQKL